MKIYDNYLSFFLKKRTLTPYMRGFLKENLLPFLPSDKEINILDVGFGKGKVISFLKEQGFRNIWGVDISKESYEYVIKNKILSQKRLERINAIKYFKRINKNFDFIICKDFLEHLNKDEIILFLKLLKKNIKKNGVGWFEVPNLQNFILGNFIFNDDFTHKTGFTENSLRQIFKISGFKKIYLFREKSPIIVNDPLLFFGSILSATLNLIIQIIIKILYIFHFRLISPKVFTSNIIAVLVND